MDFSVFRGLWRITFSQCRAHDRDTELNTAVDFTGAVQVYTKTKGWYTEVEAEIAPNLTREPFNTRTQKLDLTFKTTHVFNEF